LSAFFALGVIEYPRDDEGNIALPLSYVLSHIRKIFPKSLILTCVNVANTQVTKVGIGAAVAIPVIFLGVYFDKISVIFYTIWNGLPHKPPGGGDGSHGSPSQSLAGNKEGGSPALVPESPETIKKDHRMLFPVRLWKPRVEKQSSSDLENGEVVYTENIHPKKSM
jgi:hypothetical protein